eukprot:32163-Pleurochrysis_carterae.AAC.1
MQSVEEYDPPSENPPQLFARSGRPTLPARTRHTVRHQGHARLWWRPPARRRVSRIGANRSVVEAIGPVCSLTNLSFAR